MKPLIDYLSDIEDFRRKQGQRISLANFLEMIVLAGMSGHFGINSIGRFFENNKSFFIERYNLQHGVPSSTTVFNILKELPHDLFNDALRKWMAQYVDKQSDLWIAIDGKALCSTLSNKFGARQNFKSIVSMFCRQMGVVINAKSFQNKKSHEGHVVRQLIEQFEGKGVTFTLDALHCQKKRSAVSWSLEMTM